MWECAVSHMGLSQNKSLPIVVGLLYSQPRTSLSLHFKVKELDMPIIGC